MQFSPQQFLLVFAGLCLPTILSADEPRILVDGYSLERIATEPEIVTPIGAAFDARGRLLVVESHTHHRQEDYEGPAGDRVQMFYDSDGDGQLDAWSTFAEGFHHAMHVAAGPDGEVYLVLRNAVHRLRDTTGDGVADEDEQVLLLETEVDYAHNGLSGIAIAPNGKLYLGLGENFGADYRLVGSDGNSVSGRGGAGTVFVAELDGSRLERLATGFWNPFGLCLVEGVLFCVDNDPDSSPPCRLIHVLSTGDYGFRWEYGRAGVHPLQAWDGELPGTLPMICGTGEAPTAVVFHRGYLWVTSWGEHSIERYQLFLNEDGTYRAERQIVVQGDADFRPTGLAVAPDGSLYFGDWVDRSYPVHGKGRIWRLELPKDDRVHFEPSAVTSPTWECDTLSKLIAHKWHEDLSDGQRDELLRNALTDPDPQVRLFAVRWIGDDHLTELSDDVAALLDDSTPGDRYYLALLGAVDWLDHEREPRHSGIGDGLLARELRNEQRSPASKAIALRLISPDYKDVTLELLNEYLTSSDASLRLEAVRTLSLRTDEQRLPMLAGLVEDESLAKALRVEALVGLAAAVEEYRESFDRLAASGREPLSGEAHRILRLRGFAELPREETPATGDLEAWNRLLASGGDAASGRRLFFSPLGPQCSACHRYEGRGNPIGPDLSQIAQQGSRERIIESILNPSAEIAPRYQAWLLRTDDGRSHIGLRLHKSGDDGRELYADTAGQTFELLSENVEYRQPLETSLMPEGLHKSLTIQDLRDVVAFLMGE